jgi:hypothetical protein
LSALENFDISQARNPKHFNQHSASFPLALGVSAQALGISGTLDTTLLPPEIIRQKVVARKRPWVAAAAAAILVFVGVLFAREKALNRRLGGTEGGVLQNAQAEVTRIEDLQRRGVISVEGQLESLGQITSIFEQRHLWIDLVDELVKLLPTGPEGESIWLTAIGSTHEDVAQVAAALTPLPPELAAAGPGAMRDTGMRMRTGGAPDARGRGALARLEQPDRVLSVVVMGETKHPQQAAYVYREYVEKLNESEILSFAKMVHSSQMIRLMDSTGQVYGTMYPGRERGPAGTVLERRGVAEVSDLVRVEYTQFVAQAFVDPEGKLGAAIEEQEKEYDLMVRQFRGPAGP